VDSFEILRFGIVFNLLGYSRFDELKLDEEEEDIILLYYLQRKERAGAFFRKRCNIFSSLLYYVSFFYLILSLFSFIPLINCWIRGLNLYDLAHQKGSFLAEYRMDPRSFDILVNDEWRHLARVEEIDGNRIIGSYLKDRISETVTSYQYSHDRNYISSHKKRHIN
jgi:hypothetical protein